MKATTQPDGVFFAIDPQDIQEGSARYYIDQGLLRQHPELRLWNLAAQGMPTEPLDLLVIEDEPQSLSDILTQALREARFRRIGLCYSLEVLDRMRKAGMPAPKVATLDFSLIAGTTDGTRQNQRAAFHATLEAFTSLNGEWPDTVFLGITNFLQDELAKPLVDQVHSKGLMVLSKGDRLWPLLPEILWGALRKHELLVQARGLKVENERLQKELAAKAVSTGTVHARLHHTTGLFGIADVLSSVASAVQPFLDWKQGRLEDLPRELKDLHPGFVHGLLLEGEPGVGKSQVCHAISELFDVTIPLPRSLGPGSVAGQWMQHLEPLIVRAFEEARRRKLVLVLADDLTLPRTDGMLDKGLAADWQSFLLTLTECIEDSHRVNHGEPPLGAIAKTCGTTFLGKILWLFARNDPRDAVPIDRRVLGRTLSATVRFPRDQESWDAILRHHASKVGCTWDEEALHQAKSTFAPIYNGHNLAKAFIPFVRQEVFQRAMREHEAGTPLESISRAITTEILRAWLAGSAHQRIIGENQRAAPGAAAVDGDDRDSAGVAPPPTGGSPSGAQASSLIGQWDAGAIQTGDPATVADMAMAHIGSCCQDDLEGRLFDAFVALKVVPKFMNPRGQWGPRFLAALLERLQNGGFSREVGQNAIARAASRSNWRGSVNW